MEKPSIQFQNSDEDVKSWGSEVPYLHLITPPSKSGRDIGRIKLNLLKMSQFPLNQFARILKDEFTPNAEKLLVFFAAASYPQKALLALEAKRIITKVTIDPFSNGQGAVIDNWKKTFIAKKIKDNPAAGDIFKNFIEPWIIPFMYGRTTLNKGQRVPLLEAVNDLMIVCANGPTGENTWVTPYWLGEGR